MDVYTFEKTLEQRLEEYLEVLRYNDEPIPPSRIRSEWCDFLDFEIEHSGWQAIWKMPRILCEEFKVIYPNMVLVTVKNICFKLLVATVTVTGVQDDDIHLPDILEAELMELFPTKKQEFDTLDMDRTANSLDKYKFFYENLWMPFDINLDDNVDWTGQYLKPRLELYFALRSGVIHEPKCSYIKGIIKEAKYLQTVQNNIEAEMSDNEEEEPQDPKISSRLLEINLRMKQIQELLAIFENNQMWDLLDVSGLPYSALNICAESEIYFVSQKCTTNDHLKYVKKSQEFIPTDSLVQYCHNLESVLDSCRNDNTIIISPGTYSIQSMLKIKEVCTIKGIYSPSETNLETLVENSYFISTFNKVVIENLTIDAKNLQSALIVVYGTLFLKNCVIVGDGKSITRQGISISPNCSLEAEHCEIYNFSTGIFCHKDSKVILRDSIIRECLWGMQVFSGCNIKLINSNIRDSKENGVCINDDNLTEVIGDYNILESLAGFELTSSTVSNSKLANVVIKKTVQGIVDCEI